MSGQIGGNELDKSHGEPLENYSMTDTRSEIELSVGAALNHAENATWTTNELVALTLPTAVTAKEAAMAMHHAYSAEYNVRKAFQLAECITTLWSEMPSQTVDDCLNWLQKGHTYAGRLCNCFPGFDESSGRTLPFIAEWAKAWPKEYDEAKSRAQSALEAIDAAIRVTKRQQQIGQLGKT
jgi:hypothetical protein